jgi:hypothetical protein
MSNTKTYTQIFTAPLFLTAKRWKWPKCPTTDELISKNMAYSFNVILFSHEKE